MAPIFVFGQVEGGGVAAEFHLSVVQFEVHEELVYSREAFRQSIRSCLADARASGADLVVFPEYINVFLSMTNLGTIFAQSRSIQEVLGVLVAEDIAFLVENKSTVMRSILLRSAKGAEENIIKFWGPLAKEFGVAVVAGTGFVLHKEPSNVSLGFDELRNRLYVFDRNGKTIYAQDKVYLTPFETELAGLSPGTIEKAKTFSIGETQIGVTICRDTFFTVWEQLFSDADLWIDVKANGVAFTPDQSDAFCRAVPARIRSAGVPFGVTACLNGSFYDFFWEGPSSVIGPDGVITSAFSATNQEILSATLLMP